MAFGLKRKESDKEFIGFSLLVHFRHLFPLVSHMSLSLLVHVFSQSAKNFYCVSVVRHDFTDR